MVAADPPSSATAFSASWKRSHAMITTKASSTAYSTPITANLKPATSLLPRRCWRRTRRRTRKGPVMASPVKMNRNRIRTHPGRLVSQITMVAAAPRFLFVCERRRGNAPVQSRRPGRGPGRGRGLSLRASIFLHTRAARAAGAYFVSIKSDNWIRRMAHERRMIEPFEPGQVRLGSDGHKIVSYGTSSYGYDVRRGNVVKLFTKINSPLVHP